MTRTPVRIFHRFVPTLLLLAAAGVAHAQRITAAGEPAQLDIRVAGGASIRVTLRPVSFTRELPEHPAIAERAYPAPALSVRELTRPVQRNVGSLQVELRPNPLTLVVSNSRGQRIQEIVFERDGTMTFALDDQPVLGMGGGGPRPERGTPFREQPVQFDRRGALDTMEPRWQSDMYGSRNPVAMLLGTRGWGIFVTLPWVHVDMRDAARGRFIPWIPPDTMQGQRVQHEQLGKGTPPRSAIVPGLLDFFVFDAHDPAAALKDFSVITGPAAMPPKWTLGYMQSHRTLEDEAQLLDIIDTFRAKQIPLDAVIYLGTGFAPRGWNTRQPSFEFNPEVFQRDPRVVLAEMEAKHVRTVVHMVPHDRNRLPTLHGTIPPKSGEVLDESHIYEYWQQHVPLVQAGVDAFWPDEGDWFNLWERLKRHQMYYQGMLLTKPNERPWHLQRNGYPGIAQWGGWVWSGDTETSWKTLEAQIAVGLNYGLSVAPFWGSDIAGFYPNRELTGELYARWFQFAAFCGSFRSHGRTWWLRLPWGWGLSDMGPREHDNANRPLPPDHPRQIRESELNNPTIEPIAKKYAELRYQLMPYTYTLAWEARAHGLPLMRALWLHYPDDVRARGIGNEYLWGRDLLIAPVFEQGATSRDVYLPAGDWYDWWTNERLTGGRTVSRPVDLTTMPIYARAGAIIPFDPVRQYTAQAVSEPTTLRIYRGADGDFTLYDDDGISLDYAQGRGTWTRIRWNDGARQLTLEPAPPSGATNIEGRREFRVLILPDSATRTITYSGQHVRVDFSTPPVSAMATTGRIGPVIQNGMLMPVAEFADSAQWIRTRVWVETPYDTDGDGRKDRLHADITRPAAAERAGVRLPVLMQSSPYAGGTNGPRQYLWNVKQELGVEPAPRTSAPPSERQNRPVEHLAGGASTWVPRGFVFVTSEQLGTGLSTGCPTIGDVYETNGPRYVIDWLNGRAKAYTSVDGNEEVSATAWTNGRVGMYGGSYLGTLPISAAISGVRGLEAIIASAPNTSYYHYYRSNGLVRSPGGWLGEDIDFLYDYVHSNRNLAMRESCNRIWRDSVFAKHRDRATGDFNDFWAVRDQLPHVGNIRAAVLFVHGFNDWNVVPEHTIRMWEGLRSRRSDARIYLHQGGHGGSGPPADYVNRFWAHYLYDVDNGIDRSPRAMIVPSHVQPPPGGGRGASAPAVAYDDYPVPGSARVTLHLGAGGNTIGTLRLTHQRNQGPEKITDDYGVSPDAMAAAASSSNRLLYALPAFRDTVHLSGTTRVTVRLASSKPAANLSVYLVKLPYDSTRIGTEGRAGVVTRGWADPQNYKSLTRGGNYASKARGEPLVPGRFYTLRFDLQPDDQHILPGEQLALMIFSSDANFTLHPNPGTELTIDLDGTSVSLPLVGGTHALRSAGVTN